jgi:hypothetical protein
MEVTEAGIVTPVRAAAIMEGIIPMEVTEAGIVTLPFLPPGQQIKISPACYTICHLSIDTWYLTPDTSISVRPLQSEKAYSPMEVTEAGIVTLVSPLQPKKASIPDGGDRGRYRHTRQPAAIQEGIILRWR